MKKDLIFLGESGLTSTSANHIANLAKEYIQNIEFALNSMDFYEGKVTIIGSNNYNVVNEGASSNNLAEVPDMLDCVYRAKSLIAWLREGIKAKDSLLKEVKYLDLQNFCEMKGLEYPIQPEEEDTLTEDEYVSKLSIKDRNRYYMLQTKCAVLGQAIHPTGHFSNARKELANKVQHPHAISGTGRDALLYTYTPTVTTDEVEDLFFKLQSDYRASQAELNGILHKKDEAITLDEQTKSAKYAEECDNYSNAIASLNAQLRTFKVEAAKGIQELKIVIPNELKSIYDTISKLGKD